MANMDTSGTEFTLDVDTGDEIILNTENSYMTKNIRVNSKVNYLELNITNINLISTSSSFQVTLTSDQKQQLVNPNTKIKLRYKTSEIYPASYCICDCIGSLETSTSTSHTRSVYRGIAYRANGEYIDEIPLMLLCDHSTSTTNYLTVYKLREKCLDTIVSSLNGSY